MCRCLARCLRDTKEVAAKRVVTVVDASLQLMESLRVYTMMLSPQGRTEPLLINKFNNQIFLEGCYLVKHKFPEL